MTTALGDLELLSVTRVGELTGLSWKEANRLAQAIPQKHYTEAGQIRIPMFALREYLNRGSAGNEVTP